MSDVATRPSSYAAKRDIRTTKQSVSRELSHPADRCAGPPGSGPNPPRRTVLPLRRQDAVILSSRHLSAISLAIDGIPRFFSTRSTPSSSRAWIFVRSVCAMSRRAS